MRPKWEAPTGVLMSCARVLTMILVSFSVLSGLWSYHLVRGEHTMASSYTDEMIRLAPRMQNDGMLIQADWASGCSRFFKGQFTEAHASLSEAAGCTIDKSIERWRFNSGRILA